MGVLQNVGCHVLLMNLCDQGALQVSQCGFWFPKQTPMFPSISKLSGEQWLMNSWYEYLTLLESRNMLMNSGRSPNICKVMTKVVMDYSWLAYSCSEAQRFIPAYIQHLWVTSSHLEGGGCLGMLQAGWGPTGVLVLSCSVHVLHLKATGTSGLCEGSKPLPICKARCTSSSKNTGLGRRGTAGKEETEHQIRRCQWPQFVQGAARRRLKLMKEMEWLPGQQGLKDLGLDHFKLGRGLFSGNTTLRWTAEKDGKNLH